MPIVKPEIFDVTYNEVMQLWNISERAAVRRLTIIRTTLKKKRWQKLTVVQYCKAEDISEEEFYKKIL